jgi:SM-20-related protein
VNTKTLSSQLLSTGLCVWPNFLSKINLKKTCADFDKIKLSGAFKRACIGQGAERDINDLRRDETFWLDDKSTNKVQINLWRQVNLLKVALNKKLFLGISSFEGHYASYPIGGFYRRHLDSFAKDDTRVVSFILYLNQNWQPTDGGTLRVYNKDHFTDVNPQGGTLACFMSRESEHEVLESHATRSSFTGWFRVKKTLDIF